MICRTLESREVMSKRAVPAGSKNRKNENLKNESGRTSKWLFHVCFVFKSYILDICRYFFVA